MEEGELGVWALVRGGSFEQLQKRAKVVEDAIGGVLQSKGIRVVAMTPFSEGTEVELAVNRLRVLGSRLKTEQDLMALLQNRTSGSAVVVQLVGDGVTGVTHVGFMPTPLVLRAYMRVCGLTKEALEANLRTFKLSMMSAIDPGMGVYMDAKNVLLTNLSQRGNDAMALVGFELNPANCPFSRDELAPKVTAEAAARMKQLLERKGVRVDKVAITLDKPFWWDMAAGIAAQEDNPPNPDDDPVHKALERMAQQKKLEDASRALQEDRAGGNGGGRDGGGDGDGDEDDEDDGLEEEVQAKRSQVLLQRRKNRALDKELLQLKQNLVANLSARLFHRRQQQLSQARLRCFHRWQDWAARASHFERNRTVFLSRVALLLDSGGLLRPELSAARRTNLQLTAFLVWRMRSQADAHELDTRRVGAQLLAHGLQQRDVRARQAAFGAWRLWTVRKAELDARRERALLTMRTLALSEDQHCLLVALQRWAAFAQGQAVREDRTARGLLLLTKALQDAQLRVKFGFFSAWRATVRAEVDREARRVRRRAEVVRLLERVLTDHRRRDEFAALSRWRVFVLDCRHREDMRAHALVVLAKAVQGQERRDLRGCFGALRLHAAAVQREEARRERAGALLLDVLGKEHARRTHGALAWWRACAAKEARVEAKLLLVARVLSSANMRDLFAATSRWRVVAYQSERRDLERRTALHRVLDVAAAWDRRATRSRFREWRKFARAPLLARPDLQSLERATVHAWALRVGHALRRWRQACEEAHVESMRDAVGVHVPPSSAPLVERSVATRANIFHHLHALERLAMAPY